MPAEGRQRRPEPALSPQDAAFVGYGHVVTDAQRAAWQSWVNDRAQDSYRRGCDASHAGRLDEAIFWLSRARRMARDNPNVAFALASACLTSERWDECSVLMLDLWRRFHLREAAIGAALALYRLGDADGARLVAGGMLATCAAPPDIVGLMDPIARRAGLPGWCALSGQGPLRIACARPVLVKFDARRAVRTGAAELAVPPGIGRIRVTCDGRDLLGSPIDARAIGRIEGFVRATPFGIEGWVWHPAEPERVPVLTIQTATDLRAYRAAIFAEDVSSDVPVARPRQIRIPARTLPPGAVSLRGPDGRMLSGSPLDPASGVLLDRNARRPARFASVPVTSARRRRRLPAARPRTLVVVPVFADLDATRTCLETLRDSIGPDADVLVIDDGSPDPAIARLLDAWQQDGVIALLRNVDNLGFPVAVNQGLARAGGRDVVLLNSDTLLPGGAAPTWLDRLRDAAYAQADTGTVTPLSNRASILSYPDPAADNPMPDRAAVTALAIDAAHANGSGTIEIPTANGFCMFIRHDCLEDVGRLREDVFAQGYGEENDFCMRARRAGFRHVAAIGVYVGHQGSVSFGATRTALMARNAVVVEALHPGYEALVADHIGRDPLFDARRRMDLLRLGRLRAGRALVLMVLHDGGGGVARVVRQRAAHYATQGTWTLILKPHPRGCVLIVPGQEREFASLRFDLPQDHAFFLAMLRGLGIVSIEWHHMVGHAPWIRGLHTDLGVPHDIFIHDYVWFCQRISLIGPGSRYCGEPDLTGCERCVALLGSHLGERIGMQDLVERSSAELTGARRLMAPSHDAARRIRRHFGPLDIAVTPLEDDTGWPPPARVALKAERRICILGGIGVEKGFEIVLALAEDASRRALPLSFVLVGHTPQDESLIATGKVLVTGEFHESEAQALIAEAACDFGFIPSITAETWCFALGQLWQAGLAVMAFDIGAQAERIRARRVGWLAPLGIPPAALNDLFIRTAS